MTDKWRIQVAVLTFLMRVAEGDAESSLDPPEASGFDIQKALPPFMSAATNRTVRSQLDYLSQRGYLSLNALRGAGVDPLECVCSISALGADVARGWTTTRGRALLLMEIVLRASNGLMDRSM